MRSGWSLAPSNELVEANGALEGACCGCFGPLSSLISSISGLNVNREDTTCFF